ncbi:MAG: response regulator [Steroidobacteraceae bacterium]
MKAFRRSLLALGLAALLPIVVFVAVQVVFTLKRDREDLEAAYLTRTADVMRILDARVEADLNALRVFVSSTFSDTPDWDEFFIRANRVLADNPHWRTILVTDAATGRVIVDAAEPAGATQPPFKLDEGTRFQNDRGTVGGIAVHPNLGPTPLVYLQQPVLRDNDVLYRVTLAVSPTVYQSMVVEQVPLDTVAAVVDRSGRFIARTLNYEKRVGQLATPFLREALAGRSGFYRGTTWEGLENYTAFTTSDFSGWSTHIAVPKQMFDGSRLWSYLVSGVAGLLALLVGVFLALLVLREMADRRQADESLLQAQKMEAIGQLTGGIAHDFNNLLTAIIGGLDIIHRRAGDERMQRVAANALEAARRGAKLTSQLLTFSRKQPMAMAAVDLQALLDGMTSLLTQSLGPQIRIVIHIEPDARYVTSDAGQLELSILNLAVNARDAMPNGGRFAVKSRVAEDALHADLPGSEYVQIEVSDTGVGMSEEVKTRAFEPFFTTKALGAGTGLGLSQVFGVVQQSQGSTHIRSAVGAGTTVIMVLPSALPPVASAAPVVESNSAPDIEPTGANVLVVDDDRQVRRIMVASLRSRGYRVAEATNGAEALHLMSASRPDLLLIDFSMPGRNGADIARSARQIHPQLKVLIVSGHADLAAIADAVGSVPLLHKPFDPETLAAMVERVLNDELAGQPASSSV